MTSTSLLDEGEFNYARSLVNPDKLIRDQTLQKLHCYITSLERIDDLTMLKLWKALYYCMWLSDKQEIQSELALSLCGLIDLFRTDSLVLQYIRMFYKTILREWCNLDQYRVNKFYLLIRLFLNKTLEVGKKSLWSSDFVQELLAILRDEILTKRPNGIRFHLADIYLHELLVVTGGVIEVSVFMTLCHIFIDALLRVDDCVFLERIVSGFFLKFVEEFAGENKQDGFDELLFPVICTLALQKKVFDTAADHSTPDSARKRLYTVHKSLASKSGHAFVTPEDLQISKKTTKRSSVAEGVVNVKVSRGDEVTTSKKIKTAPATTADEATSGRHIKAKKQRISEKLNEDPVVAKGGSVVAEEPVRVASSPALENTSDRLAPFVASAKFTGAKAGYVFHRGVSGVGYYLDTKASNSKKSNTNQKDKKAVHFVADSKANKRRK